MKKIAVVLLVFAVLLSPVLISALNAEESSGKAPASAAGEKSGAACEKSGAASEKSGKEKPQLSDMTVTGKISKEQVTGKDGKEYTRYLLTDSQGNKVMLSAGGHKHGKKGEAAQEQAVNFGDYVDKDVKVAGKGFQHEMKGKTLTRIVKISTIEVVAAPAGQ